MSENIFRAGSSFTVRPCDEPGAPTPLSFEITQIDDTGVATYLHEGRAYLGDANREGLGEVVTRIIRPAPIRVQPDVGEIWLDESRDMWEIMDAPLPGSKPNTHYPVRAKNRSTGDIEWFTADGDACIHSRTARDLVQRIGQ